MHLRRKLFVGQHILRTVAQFYVYGGQFKRMQVHRA